MEQSSIIPLEFGYKTGGSQHVAAPGTSQGGLVQVVGSEVHPLDVEPKFAVELLQVQPTYHWLFSAQAAPTRYGVGVVMKNEDKAVGEVVVSAFSVAPFR